jgi:hypothetical protein
MHSGCKSSDDDLLSDPRLLVYLSCTRTELKTEVLSTPALHQAEQRINEPASDDTKQITATCNYSEY